MPHRLVLAVLLALTLGSCVGSENEQEARADEIPTLAEGISVKAEALLSFLQKQDRQLTELTAAELDQVTKVRLDHDYTGDELALLAELPELREVLIWRAGEGRDKYQKEAAPTEADLQVLASFEQLETLRIGGWNSPLRDAGVAALTGMPALKHLTLIQTQRISDEAMKSVAQMPVLESLDISYTNITDVGLANLLTSSSLKAVRYGWGNRTKQWLEAFQGVHSEPGFVME